MERQRFASGYGGGIFPPFWTFRSRWALSTRLLSEKSFPGSCPLFRTMQGFCCQGTRPRKEACHQWSVFCPAQIQIIAQKWELKLQIWAKIKNLLDLNYITKSLLRFKAAASQVEAEKTPCDAEWVSFFWQSMVLLTCNADYKTPLIWIFYYDETRGPLHIQHRTQIRNLLQVPRLIICSWFIPKKAGHSKRAFLIQLKKSFNSLHFLVEDICYISRWHCRSSEHTLNHYHLCPIHHTSIMHRSCICKWGSYFGLLQKIICQLFW